MTFPSWTYKLITVDNLEKIQQELKPLVEKYVPECFNGKQVAISQYIPITSEEITEYSPSYAELIKTTGYFDRWYVSVLSTASKLSSKSPSIHIDHFNPEIRSYGLNIPLFNCKDTYTIWYDATIDHNPIPTGVRELSRGRLINYDLPYKEIDRLDVSNPAWINVHIPHCPYSEHEETRVLIGARFRPEIHEYFKNI